MSNVVNRNNMLSRALRTALEKWNLFLDNLPEALSEIEEREEQEDLVQANETFDVDNFFLDPSEGILNNLTGLTSGPDSQEQQISDLTGLGTFVDDSFDNEDQIDDNSRREAEEQAKEAVLLTLRRYAYTKSGNFGSGNIPEIGGGKL